MLQSHQLVSGTAAQRDQGAIWLLSEVHCREFKDDIEPLSNRRGNLGTVAPADRDVGRLMSTLQAIFDSVARELSGPLRQDSVHSFRTIRLSATDDSQFVNLDASVHSDGRLLELACVAFAGLAIGDSGANLAQIQRFEEPDDLLDQLANPDRVNLTHRVVKLRAGGKLVPVNLTTTTLSRWTTYLTLRERLVALLGGADVAPIFVQCWYRVVGNAKSEPVAIRPLDGSFLAYLRGKVKAIGAELPKVTLRQLRSFKQQSVVRKQGVRAAADTLGHSTKTAVMAYCNAQEDVRRGEMGQFLASLETAILPSDDGGGSGVQIVSTPAGGCREHGKPIALEKDPVIEPACDKTEGCFFCAQFRVHADVEDTRKLLSCRLVLQRLAPLQGESARSDKAYAAVKDRIDTVLAELRERAPEMYEQARIDVEELGNLSRYWAAKLQQLHLLGMLRQA